MHRISRNRLVISFIDITLGTIISAELKLVITSNHDNSLDPTPRIKNMSEEEYSNYHGSALEIMTGPLAKESGVTYLEEGTHTFTLSNGAKFTVYASPYTPGSGGWAFSYQDSKDRFKDAKQAVPNRNSIAANPIPSSVEIVITHGPPYSILDQVDNENLGCRNLLRAVGRVRRLMHCFGHIQEGHSTNIVTWKSDGTVKDPAAAMPLETEQINAYPYANE